MQVAVLREFRTGPAPYRHFVPGADWLQQVQDFENARARGWNTAIGVEVPMAVVNAYGVVLGIHQPGRERTVVQPVALVLPDPIHLHLQGDHYAPLVANEENVPLSTPSVVGEVGSQAEDDVPRSPPNMENVLESKLEPELEPASNPVLTDVHSADDDGDDDGASILSVAATHLESLRDPVQSNDSEADDFELAPEPRQTLKPSLLFPAGKDTAQRRKARTPNTPQVAPLGTTNSAQYLPQQRSQKTNPKFTPAQVILFRRLYEELRMDTRTRLGWETFDRRWHQGHKDDDIGAIHHRTRKSLADHASS